MLQYLLQGLLFGFAYVAPIGMQNMYVINRSISCSRKQALLTALIVIIFDISLSVSAFFGVGFLLEKNPWVRDLFMLAGGVVIAFIGILLFRSKPAASEEKRMDSSILKTIVFSFSVTWFNPQALIDGTFIFGSYRASLPGMAGTAFILAASAASFLWFFSLAALIGTFRHRITASLLAILNKCCGVIILFFGLKLLFQFILSM